MSQHSDAPSIGELIEQRLNRRDAMRGLLGAGMVAAFSPLPSMAQETGPSTLTFKELAHTLDAQQHVAEGYDMQVVIRWGDPVVAGAPSFDPAQPDRRRAGQAVRLQQRLSRPLRTARREPQQRPLPDGRQPRIHQLQPDVRGPRCRPRRQPQDHQGKVEVEMAAVGGAVIELVREGNAWKVVDGSRYARRISANTPIDIFGPAAGHDLLKTSADPAGRQVLGTINNCAGGSTPWGTWLTCEENFDVYFGGDSSKLPLPEMQKRYGVGRATAYGWSRHIDRFDLSKEPNEPNRFGWVVEIDPYDPGAPR